MKARVRRRVRQPVAVHHETGQSAMEYLMTYGWAILVIAIVLGVLYYFGVFSPHFTTSCIAAPGYVCQSPQLNGSGYLSINFAQLSGSAVTLTGIACSVNNATPPTSFNGVYANLQSGNQQTVIFQCPVSGVPVGYSFAGYLWVQYSMGGQTGLVARYAAITGQVSRASSVYSTGAVLAGVLGYVPITITNTQSIATAGNFDQLIQVNSAAYANAINSKWSNVEFSSAPGGAGTVYQAWVESGASNTSSTYVYVKLPGGIAASSNTVIYMDMMASNVMSSAGPTGEAPQLSPGYAQYDNGALVFEAYINGLTSPSAFTTSHSFVVSSATGVTYGGGTVNALEFSGNGCRCAAITYNTGLSNTNTVFQSNFEWQCCGTGGIAGVADGLASGGPNGIGMMMGNPSPYIEGFINGAPAGSTQGSASTSWNYGQLNYTAGSSSFFIFMAPQLFSLSGGYDETVSGSSISGSAGSIYMLVVAYANVTGINIYVNWWCAMPMAPNGVMPTVTFGAFA